VESLETSGYTLIHIQSFNKAIILSNAKAAMQVITMHTPANTIQKNTSKHLQKTVLQWIPSHCRKEREREINGQTFWQKKSILIR
jgi:hypothetical protein